MAFPTIAATNTSSTGLANNISINLPANIQAGDLLLMIVTGQQPNPRTFNPPSGWTTLHNSPGPGNLRFFYVGYRIATGSEGSTASGTIGGNEARTAHITYRITNYQGTPEIEVTTGSSSAPNAPSLSPSWGAADTLWLAVGGSQPYSSQSAPSNYSSLINIGEPGNSFVASFSAHRTLRAASENPGAFGSSVTNWAAATIAVQGLGAAVAPKALHYHRLRRV